MRAEYCPNCFQEDYNGKKCLYCGYVDESEHMYGALLPGIQLKSRYKIGRVLGAGGFGITYLAYDTQTKLRCAVKEYYPLEFSVRRKDEIRVMALSVSKQKTYQHGIQKFVEEAEHLYFLKNIPNIVDVRDFFRENGTAYIVMDFLDGLTLEQELERVGGKIPYQKATDILLSAIQTLACVHQNGLIHRDISPENIFLTKKGKVVLIDFGAARKYLEQKRNAQGSFSILFKFGFTPLEQYSATEEQGTWTDVYALAATYYYVVSGEKVPAALDRQRHKGGLAELSDKCPQVPPEVSGVIHDALEVEYRDRIQDMNQFYMQMCRALGRDRQSAPGAAAKGYVSRICMDGKKQKWELPPNKPMLMGRTMGDKCDIIVDAKDVSISRKHCYVTYLPQCKGFQICDISANGTFVPQGRLIKNKKIFFPVGTVFYVVSDKYKFMLEVE